MLSRAVFVAQIRAAALADLGADAFSRACVVLSAVTQRLASEVLGEQLRYVSGIAGVGTPHSWCESVTGEVIDVQPGPPRVWAPRGPDYRPVAPQNAIAEAICRDVWSYLEHSPHVAKADQVAERIYREALRTIVFCADADVDTRMHILRAGHVGLVEAWLRSAPGGQTALATVHARNEVLSAAGINTTPPALGAIRVDVRGYFYGQLIDPGACYDPGRP